MMRRGHSFKDTICPDVLSFEKDHFIMDNRFGRALFLKDYASYIKDSLVAELCELNRNLFFSLDIIPIPTDEAVREVEISCWASRLISPTGSEAEPNNNFSAVFPTTWSSSARRQRSSWTTSPPAISA